MGNENKEKEIEQMMNITRGYKDTVCVTPYDEAVFHDIMGVLVNAGYRKTEDVRKETAKEIFNALYHQEEIGFSKIKWFAKYYYDVEVDE